MKSITVCTSDRLIWRRLWLLFNGRYEVVMRESLNDRAHGDIVIVDLDTHAQVRNGDIFISRSCVPGAYPIPLSLEDIENAVNSVEKRDTCSLILLKEDRAVKLFGEVIPLTDVEFRVLEMLAYAPVKEYVSRERLIREVWDGACDGGVVSVYIHYLRSKLEKNGDKVIISSRREGYRLDERIKVIC